MRRAGCWSLLATFTLVSLDRAAGVPTPVFKGFRLTEFSYSDNRGYETACQTEFGPQFKLADWTEDVKPRIVAAATEDASKMIGMDSYPPQLCSAIADTYAVAPGSAAWVRQGQVAKVPGSVERYHFMRQDFGVPNCWFDTKLGTHGKWTLIAGTELVLPALCVAPMVQDMSSPEFIVPGYQALPDTKCRGTVYNGYTAPQGVQTARECSASCSQTEACDGFDLDMASACYLIFLNGGKVMPAGRSGIACYLRDHNYLVMHGSNCTHYRNCTGAGMAYDPANPNTTAPTPVPTPRISDLSDRNAYAYFARVTEVSSNGFSRFMRIATTDPDDRTTTPTLPCSSTAARTRRSSSRATSRATSPASSRSRRGTRRRRRRRPRRRRQW